ncbi:hypothetical protein LAT59_04395 [Candidatus Gracilibacteria bacterium]|nr:hypothetical protein [Candidatus Gracilibacteria bacterium]
MKENKKNILDDFSDISGDEKRKILNDFKKLQALLKPSSDYKERLFSRLQAIKYHNESNISHFQKYVSGILAFTFCFSGIWYFYTHIDTDRTYKDGTKNEQGVQGDEFRGVATPSTMEIAPSNDSMMRDMGNLGPSISEYSDEEKEIFQEKCKDQGGFFIEGENLCIIEMSDICSLESLRNEQENDCSIFYNPENIKQEILPYEGQ